jgi:hypothetical protein
METRQCKSFFPNLGKWGSKINPSSRVASLFFAGVLCACSPAHPPPAGFVDACYGGNFAKNLNGSTPKLYLRIRATPEQWPLLADKFKAFGALHDLKFFDTSVNEPGLRMLNVHLCSDKGIWLSADKRLWDAGPRDLHPDEMPIALYTYGRGGNWQVLASEFKNSLNDWPGGIDTQLPNGETIHLTSSP